MANGNTLKQLRDMADKDKLSPEQALPLLMAAVADIYEEMKISRDWRKGADDRLDKLESKDTRFVAVVSATAAAFGSLLTFLAITMFN